MRRLLDIQTRTDDNRLVDIRASSPYRAGFITDAVGAAHAFESPSKDISEP